MARRTDELAAEAQDALSRAKNATEAASRAMTQLGGGPTPPVQQAETLVKKAMDQLSYADSAAAVFALETLQEALTALQRVDR